MFAKCFKRRGPENTNLMFQSLVLKCSHLGPALFNISVNNSDTELEGRLGKFTNEIKLGEAADSLKGRETLQRDLNQAEVWASTRHVKFYKESYQILQP